LRSNSRELEEENAKGEKGDLRSAIRSLKKENRGAGKQCKGGVLILYGRESRGKTDMGSPGVQNVK